MLNLDELKVFLDKHPARVIMVDDQAQRKLVDFYYSAFGIIPDCSGCHNDISTSIGNLRKLIADPNFTIKTIIMNYKLKPGVRMHSKSAQIVVTEKNCTDANAVALLSDNVEKNKALFEKLAPDWKEAVKAFQAKTAERNARKAAEIEAKEKAKAEKLALSAAASKLAREAKAQKIASKVPEVELSLSEIAANAQAEVEKHQAMLDKAVAEAATLSGQEKGKATKAINKLKQKLDELYSVAVDAAEAEKAALNLAE